MSPVGRDAAVVERVVRWLVFRHGASSVPSPVPRGTPFALVYDCGCFVVSHSADTNRLTNMFRCTRNRGTAVCCDQLP